MLEKKFETIMNLMEELQEEMQYGEDDLAERLGRPKPQVEVMSIEGEMEPEMDEMAMEEEGPEAKLKNRLMKLRGA